MSLGAPHHLGDDWERAATALLPSARTDFSYLSGRGRIAGILSSVYRQFAIAADQRRTGTSSPGHDVTRPRKYLCVRALERSASLGRLALYTPLAKRPKHLSHPVARAFSNNKATVRRILINLGERLRVAERRVAFL